MLQVITISILIIIRYEGKLEFVFESGFSILQVGKDISLKLNETLMKGLEEENKLGPTKPIFGFLR